MRTCAITPAPRSRESGVTLVEILIAVALIAIGVLAAAQTFSVIQKSIQYSKGRTIATNIAQEKIQIIMQKTYYAVLVTTAPAFRVEASTTIAYDPGYFAPETVTEGGITFTRYTYVQVIQENSGVIETLSPDTPDTGMRQITETVVWKTDSGVKYLSVQSVLNNPNTVMSRSILRGVVKDSSTLTAISSALVDAAENVGWRDTTDASGNYLMNLSPGTFNFLATAPGYFPNVQMLSVAANSSTSYNFFLIRISSGSVKGTVWLNNHPVISQVGASTGTANGIEYIELYNPTTSAITIGSNGTSNNPNVWPIVWDASNVGKPRHLFYMTAGNSVIPSYGYYLMSNTGNADPATTCGSLTVGGVTQTPDACWLHVSAPNHAIECAASPCPTGGNLWSASSMDAGGVSLGNASSVLGSAVDMGNWTANRIDSLGWAQSAAGNAAPGSAVEGTPLQAIFGGGKGLPLGEQFVRKMSTGTISGAFGRAYDANLNNTDFSEIGPLSVVPNTSAFTAAPLTGTPATGAIISVNDGLSVAAAAVLTGNPPYALFTVPGVATGTWIVLMDSGSVSTEIDTVTVSGNATTWIPSATTSPAWRASGYYSAVLTSPGIVGMISGTVKDAVNSAIIGPLSVTAGNVSTTVGTNGYYTLRLSTGVYDVIANPSNGNSMYASVTQSAVSVNLGDMTGNVNFNISKGGKVRGWITRDGTNPLPGVTVVARDVNGIERDSEVSGSNGNFLLINLTTGTYSIETVLDLKEVSTPATSAVTVSAGNTAWSSTFTVTGAMGTVMGSVTKGGAPIKSGVLVIVSTSAISNPPPALSSNTLTSASYYADSSTEDGTYAVDVRGSTSTVYNVVGLYMTLSGQTPVISSRTVSNVTVIAGQTTRNINFAW